MSKIGLSHLLSFAKFSVTFCPPSSKRWQELEAHTWWYFATNDATLNLNSGRYTIEETPLEPTQQPVFGINMTYTLNDIGQLQVHVRGIEVDDLYLEHLLHRVALKEKRQREEHKGEDETPVEISFTIQRSRENIDRMRARPQQVQAVRTSGNVNHWQPIVRRGIQSTIKCNDISL